MKKTWSMHKKAIPNSHISGYPHIQGFLVPGITIIELGRDPHFQISHALHNDSMIGAPH